MEGDLDLLVDAARAGGGWAFARIWEQLAPGVAGYLRARGHRDPDDGTSEVFLAAFTRMPQFVGDSRDFRSWLFTIAHHKAADSHRRGPSARERPAEVVDDGRTHRSAEEDALDRMGDAGVTRLLRGLTEDQRSVLLLRVVADLDLRETARVLGKPVGAVKSLQHRALETLRRQLRDPAVSPETSAAIARSR